MKYAGFALWAAAAGALIPPMAVLSARLGRAPGAPSYAALALFAVAFAAASLASLAMTGRWPSLQSLSQIRPLDLAGGSIVAFYVLSTTVLAPAFGVARAYPLLMDSKAGL